MQTRADEIADGIYRLSTHLPEVAGPDGFTFNQFLIRADEPLIFHCGQRALFPSVSAAVARLMPLDRLRWISFGHIEADECGAMNLWLAAAPDAQVVYSALGCDLSVNDLADRPPRAMAENEVLDLGGKRVRFLPTPHVPHNWEAQMLYEEVTGTLFCGDLFTHTGNGAPVVETSLTDAAMAAEDLFGASSLAPATASTLRRLAGLSPRMLVVMHGSSFRGDGQGMLRALADRYEERTRTAMASQAG
jgi:flavorubredoxin